MHVNEGKIRNFPCSGEITDLIPRENKRNRGNHGIMIRSDICRSLTWCTFNLFYQGKNIQSILFVSHSEVLRV